MNDLVRAVDISNYTGEPDDNMIGHIRAEGDENGAQVEHVVVRGSLETPAMQTLASRQMQRCAREGFTVSAYLWCYFTENPRAMIQQALRLFEDDAWVFWLDVEETRRVKAPKENVAWLWEALDELEKHQAWYGIYTGAWYWAPYLGGSKEFQQFPLWTADYNRTPTLDVPLYGGWDHAIGHQYAVDNPQAIDLNVFDGPWLRDHTREQT